jgi:hypothetical protein
MPPNSVYIGRPSRWQNPHPIGERCFGCGPGTVHTRDEAVAAFRQWLVDHPHLVEHARAELAGKTLVCWCPTDVPCHGDVWLELLAGVRS